MTLDDYPKYTYQDIAAMFGLSRSTIRKLVYTYRAQFTPHVRRNGSHPRKVRFFSEEEVLEIRALLRRDTTTPG